MPVSASASEMMCASEMMSAPLASPMSPRVDCCTKVAAAKERGARGEWQWQWGEPICGGGHAGKQTAVTSAM